MYINSLIFSNINSQNNKLRLKPVSFQASTALLENNSFRPSYISYLKLLKKRLKEILTREIREEGLYTINHRIFAKRIFANEIKIQPKARFRKNTNIFADNLVSIDGEIPKNVNIKSKGVRIENKGVMSGNIQAQWLDIGGSFYGEAVTEKCAFSSTAHVYGKIKTGLMDLAGNIESSAVLEFENIHVHRGLVNVADGAQFKQKGDIMTARNTSMSD